METVPDPAGRERPEDRRRWSLRRKLLATVVIAGLTAGLVGPGTWSAFSDTTANSGNEFAAGTVAISDLDSGSALFSLSEMTPSDPAVARCIIVRYDGTAPANVWLYGTTGGSGLAQYLDVKVTRGAMGSPSATCSGFTPDPTEYLAGKGNGVIYDGTLAGYPDAQTPGGIQDPSATAEVWTTNETHAYRFEVVVQNDDAAQGKTATQTFTWEARNTP